MNKLALSFFFIESLSSSLKKEEQKSSGWKKSSEAVWQALLWVVDLDSTFFNAGVGVWPVLLMYYAVTEQFDYSMIEYTH